MNSKRNKYEKVHSPSTMENFGQKIENAKPYKSANGTTIYPQHGKRLNKDKTGLEPKKIRKDRKDV